MSTRVGLIGEGPIDRPILGALLQRIATERAGYNWPVDADDLDTTLRIRKTGHGGVVTKLERLLKIIDAGQDVGCRFYVVVLDNRKLAPIHAQVKSLISRYDRVLFHVAIEELEAWWLADAGSVLGWLGLTRVELAAAGLDYGSDRYHAEKDQTPKATLDTLTRISSAVDSVYGRAGNSELADDFGKYWRDRAQLDIIEHQCPNGFRPFADEVATAFRRCLTEDAQRRGQLSL